MIEYNEKNLATPYTMISYSYAYNYATKQKKNDMAIGCEFFAKAKERLNNDIMSGPINLRYIKEIQKLIKCE